LNPRPLGYEPNELPDCSTPRQAPRCRPVGPAQRCETPNCSTRPRIRQAQPQPRGTPKRERLRVGDGLSSTPALIGCTRSEAGGPCTTAQWPTGTDGRPLQRARDAQAHQQSHHQERSRRVHRQGRNYRSQVAHHSSGRNLLASVRQETRPSAIYDRARTDGRCCAFPFGPLTREGDFLRNRSQTVRYRASSA
jgi:hypothetical protein